MSGPCFRLRRVQAIHLHKFCNLTFFFLKFKSVYAKLTKDKTKDARTLEDILVAYDNGNLRVPCVQVQCIGFDEDFFTALLAERDAGQSTVP